MTYEDRVRIVVEAEVNRAIANLQSAQKEVRATSTSFQKSNRDISSSMPKFKAGLAAIGVSAAAAGAALLAFSKQAYDVAASVQASTQVINRLFGENSKAIREFAKTADESLGISEKTALEYSAVYGNLLTSFIKDSDILQLKTEEMLQQSAVIAAATGRTIDDVNERIRSGLLGNTEAIEDLGINVNVAMIETTKAFQDFAGDKSWEQLDFNMQQQIRLSAILEQSYQKYGDSINKNVISETNKATAVFQNFQKAVGDAFIPYVEEILPKLTESMQVFMDSESNMNALVGSIQILIESLKIAWNMVGFLVDELKSGALVIFNTFINPLIDGIASLSEALGSLKLPGFDMSSYNTVAEKLRGVTAGFRGALQDTTESARENYSQMVDSFNNIADILNGNLRKSATDTENIVKRTIEDTPKAPKIVDEQWLEDQRDILLQFEIDYRETIGKNEEAAQLSINAQKEIYAQAGVDRVRLEEWADMQILRSKTDLISGIRRGFHDLALESNDFASQAESVLSSAFSGAEDALVDFVTTGQADFKAFAESILKEIARMAIKMAIIAPLQNAFSGMFGNRIVSGFGAKVAHTGGMAESVSSQRQVPASLFIGAPRYHTGGMIGADEVPIIAQKGERVLNREETKAYNSGQGVNVNVVVNNNSNEDVSVKEKQNQGGTDIEILIGDITAKQAATKGSALNNSIKTASSKQLLRR